MCVFVDGDFWHGRRIKATADNLTPFWRTKILDNVRRDKRNKNRLRRSGWKVLRIWESDLKKNPTKTFEKLHDFLKGK
jgi:DNA mismatch endonuclease (patch repair protein)